MLKRLLLLLWALSLLASLVYSAPRPANQRVGIVGGHEASESTSKAHSSSGCSFVSSIYTMGTSSSL
uniref:Tryptase beta 2 n=1 Tax=Mus musculus TaxID=10090 RepID=A0AAA9WW04_MOUSE